MWSKFPDILEENSGKPQPGNWPDRRWNPGPLFVRQLRYPYTTAAVCCFCEQCWLAIMEERGVYAGKTGNLPPTHYYLIYSGGHTYSDACPVIKYDSEVTDTRKEWFSSWLLSPMILGDGWERNFSWHLSYSWGTTPEKSQQGKLIRRGMKPRSDRWEAMALPIDYSGGHILN